MQELCENMNSFTLDEYAKLKTTYERCLERKATFNEIRLLVERYNRHVKFDWKPVYDTKRMNAIFSDVCTYNKQLMHLIDRRMNLNDTFIKYASNIIKLVS